jgi:WD40 repeat protein
MADLFISYSRHDLAFARRLTAGLERRGKDVWVDLDDIMPSAPWMAEIRVAIAEADSVVVVLSPDSVASPVCQAELQSAVDLNKRLIPVVAQPTPIADVPVTVAALNFLDFSQDTSDEAFEAGLSRLTEVLDTDLDAVHQHTRLLLRTTEWEDSDRDPARLLRGRQLNEAESWLATQGQRNPAPTAGQVALIMASRRAAIRRQRGSMAVAATVALGLIGLSIFSVLQWHTAVVQRGQANSRADSAEAQNQLQTDPPRALDLALRGLRSGDTAQAQTALRSAVAASELRAVLPSMPRAAKAAAGAADGGAGEGQVAFSPSGSYVAVANNAGYAEVWRWRAQRGRGSYGDPYRLAVPGASQTAFTDGGRRLLVLTDDGDLVAWNWRAGTKAMLRRHLSGAVLSQSGAYLAATSSSGDTVMVTKAASGQPVAVIPTGGFVGGDAFSPDGSLLATWAAGSPVTLWFTFTGHLDERLGVAPQLSVHQGEYPVALNAQNDRMAVTGDNEISVYQLAEPSLAPKELDLTVPPGAPADASLGLTPGSLAWSPNGEELAAGGPDQALRVWSGDLGGQTFVGPVANDAGGVVFSPDGTYLAGGDNRGGASVWAWGAVTDDALSVPAGVAAGATISPNGRMVAYAANPSGSTSPVELWDWRHFTTYPLTSANGFDGVNLAFSPNGRWLAVSSVGGISIWSVDTRRRLASLPISGQNALSDLTFDPSGRWLSGIEPTTSGLSNGPSTVVEWRWDSHAPARLLPGVTGQVGIAVVQADGVVRFVSGHDLMSWRGAAGDRATLVDRGVVPSGKISSAAYFDQGERMLFQVGDGTTELLNLKTGAISHALGQFDMQGNYVRSPDGRLLAGTALNGDEVVWDEDPADTPVTIPTTSGQSTVTLAAHVLLIAGPFGLSVVPDAYCGPLPEVEALANSLLVHPISLAEATAYGN